MSNRFPCHVKFRLTQIGISFRRGELAIASTKRGEIEYTEVEAGPTKSELCDRLNLTIYQAEKAAKEQGINVNDYLLKITNWKPSEGKRPKYYPANK